MQSRFSKLGRFSLAIPLPLSLPHHRKHKVAHKTKRKSPLALARLTSLHKLRAPCRSLFRARISRSSLCARPKSHHYALALNETTAQSRDCAVATKGELINIENRSGKLPTPFIYSSILFVLPQAFSLLHIEVRYEASRVRAGRGTGARH